MPSHTYEEWGRIVQQVRENDEAATIELYKLFDEDIRLIILKRMGPDHLDDRVHDLFIIVLEAIRRNMIREEQRVMGFVMTVVNRQIITWIDKKTRESGRNISLDANPAFVHSIADRRSDHCPQAPDRKLAAKEVHSVLSEAIEDKLDPVAAEIVTRFYLLEQSETEIRNALDISENRFRNTKSRAISTLRPVVNNRLNRKPIPKSLAIAA